MKIRFLIIVHTENRSTDYFSNLWYLLHARKKKEKKKTTNKIEIKTKYNHFQTKRTDIALCIAILQEKNIKNVYVFIHETYLSNNECNL